MKLFKKYEHQDFVQKKVARAFAADLEAISSLLVKRVTLEETILFPAYKKYH